MELYKKTENLEFELLYADGTKRKVNKGILFEETEDGKLDIHIGTDNQFNMFLAILDAAGKLISTMTKGKMTIQMKVRKRE